MRKLDHRNEPVGDGLPASKLAVYTIERTEAKQCLNDYAIYSNEKAENITFSRRSRWRSRLLLSSEGMDICTGRNVVGFLGVLAQRGKYWRVPHIETLYISPQLNTSWQSKIGSLLLSNSIAILYAREHRILVSTHLDANTAGLEYLRTHGFSSCTVPDEDQRGEPYGEFDHFQEQSKGSLLKQIGADLWPEKS